MKKGIIIAIIGFLGVVGTFLLWGLTPEDQYILNGGFYVLLLIGFLFFTLYGLSKMLYNYYTKDRYDRLRKKYQEKYDANKSIIVNIDELIYYVNIKYLGGDDLVFKYKDEFHIIERQVLSDQKNKKFSSIYSLDEKICGSNFNNVLTKKIINNKALIELDNIEVAFVNGKFPQVLKEKRIYDNVKPHSKLMISSIVLIIFGIMFLFISTATNDWYNALIIGGIFLLVGIILLIILIKDIKDESKIK